jgi:DNA mismatch endonuclease (patch repair protein)
MDTVDKKTRSRIMSRVKSKNNRSTERRLRAALVKARISGWRMHPREIDGTPDFFFAETKFAVFVDGCFWHGCPKCYRRPQSRTEFWDEKLQRNRTRDNQVNTLLRQRGFAVLRFWEHEVREDLPTVIKKIQSVRE